MKKVFLYTPLFLFLLPVFFVLHGLQENFGFIGVSDCLLLMVTYGGAAAFLYFLFLFFYKDPVKSALIASFLMGFYLFFGALHDFLRIHEIFLHKYSLLLPLFVAITFVMIIFLRKRKYFLRTTFFLNLLFSLYLLNDLALIAWKLIRNDPNKFATYSFRPGNKYAVCDSCIKPDIYFLLFDEYSSSHSLKQVYDYDNSSLDSFLRNEDFHIQQYSRSNYFVTPFSMASILNLSYIHDVKDPGNLTEEDYLNITKPIKENEVVAFLSSMRYDIVNYSIFDIAGSPSVTEQSFFPLKTRLITNRTLPAYILRDFGWFFTNYFGESNMIMQKTILNNVNNNNKILALTKSESRKHTDRPRFIYAHLLMPHYPFFYDRNLEKKDIRIVAGQTMEDQIQPYLDYLPYTNYCVEDLLKTIKENTDGKAVIIFMSDHGLRYYGKDSKPESFFANQNAIYFPDRDYRLLYDSITGVNQFRVVFNKLFDQNIPLLKDSVIFLRDKR